MEKIELTLQDYIIDKLSKENAQLKIALAENEFRIIQLQQSIEEKNKEKNKTEK